MPDAIPKIPKFWQTLVTFRVLLLNAIIFALYVLSGKFGLSFATVNSSTTALWIPTGLALASMLIFGNIVTPAILLGAFIVNLTTSGSIFPSIAIALGNSLEALIGAYLVRRYANGTFVFRTISGIVKFTIFAGTLSTAIAATIGTTTLVLFHLADWNNYRMIWNTWWLGDAGGALVITPLILIFIHNLAIKLDWKESLRFIISFSILISTTASVFSGRLPYPYLIIPVGVWIAFRFGQRGAALSTILVATIAIYYTLLIQGPFANAGSLNRSLLLLQTFLNIYSLTGLGFAAIVLEMKNSQKMLEYSETRFKSLIEKSFEGIILIDTVSRILYASPSVKRILGYEPDELVGTTGFDLVASEDRSMTMALLAELVSKPGGSVATEYRSIRKDGREIWVEVVGTNMLLEPAIHAVVINYRDITEKKEAAAKLNEERLEDEAMLSSIGEGIIATDDTGKITLVNKATCQLLGWDEKDLIGKLVTDVFPMEDHSGQAVLPEKRPIHEVIISGKKYSSHTNNYYVTKDGERLPVRMSISPIILGEKLVGAIEVFHDVTQDLQLERSKDEFISVASHELRTPITAINGFLSMVLNGDYGPVNDQLKKPLENTYLSAKRQVNLINDLLDISRLQTRKINFTITTFSLGNAVKEVIDTLKPLADQKKITLECVECPVVEVQADLEWSKHIVSNLIGNALKFTTEGGISVSYFKKDDFVHINVIDTGIGIDTKDVTKLFQQFQQLRTSNKLNKPIGSGLGLYLSKQVAQTMGGDVFLEKSAVGKGSIFTAILPLANTARANRVKAKIDAKAKVVKEEALAIS